MDFEVNPKVILVYLFILITAIGLSLREGISSGLMLFGLLSLIVTIAILRVDVGQ